MVTDLKKKKKVPDTNAVHPQSRQRNVNTIVDGGGGGADSNDGKLSFPAHERVLEGETVMCTTGPVECESQRGERTQKYSLPQM